MSGCDSWCHHSSSNDNDHTNISIEGPICRPDGHKLKRYKLKEIKGKMDYRNRFLRKDQHLTLRLVSALPSYYKDGNIRNKMPKFEGDKEEERSGTTD